MKFVIFALFLAVSAGISSVDAYFNMKYPVTAAVEENPIAKWILVHTHDDVALLIALKLFGTSVVVGVLCCGYCLRRGVAYAIAAALAAAQMVILLHMLEVIP